MLKKKIIILLTLLISITIVGCDRKVKQVSFEQRAYEGIQFLLDKDEVNKNLELIKYEYIKMDNENTDIEELKYNWQVSLESQLQIVSKFKSETRGELYNNIYNESEKILNKISEYYDLIFEGLQLDDERLRDISISINKDIDRLNKLLEEFKEENIQKFIEE